MRRIPSYAETTLNHISRERFLTFSSPRPLPLNASHFRTSRRTIISVAAPNTSLSPKLEEFTNALNDTNLNTTNTTNIWKLYSEIQKDPTLAKNLGLYEYRKLSTIFRVTNISRDDTWNKKMSQILDDMRNNGYNWDLRDYEDFISTRLHEGLYQEAVETYKAIRGSRLGFRLQTFYLLLTAHILQNDFKGAKLLSDEALKFGLAPDLEQFKTIMRNYTDKSNKEMTQMIQRLFDEYIYFNARFQELLLEGNIGGIGALYQNWKKSNSELDSINYYQLIKIYVENRRMDDAAMVYSDYLMTNHRKREIRVYNTMIDGYVYSKNMKKAEDILKDMFKADVDPDGLTFNNLIQGYFNTRDIKQALKVFEKIKSTSNIPITEVLCNTMINGLMRAKEVEAAKRLYESMRPAGYEPTLSTYNILLRWFMSFGDFPSAIAILDEMIKRKVDPDIFTFTTFLDRFFAIADTAEDVPNLISALKAANVGFNAVAHGAIVAGWVRHNNMKAAEAALTDMRKAGFRPHVHVYTSMIGGYFKTGHISKAMATFSKMRAESVQPDRATFHTIISGYILNGKISDALTSFREMRSYGVMRTPDTYFILLDVLYQKRMVREAEEILEDITETNLISPDGLALARRIRRVKSMIKELKPDHKDMPKLNK